MTDKRPYDIKLDWAEQHLVKMETLITEWVALHPHKVLPAVEDKRQPPRLHFEPKPSGDIRLILGDFLYNVRASLDYVMKALTPSANRGRINFPIFWQGVWEPAVESDDKQRLDDRRAWRDWASLAKGVAPEARAIIMKNQPPTAARDGDHHALAVLNRLRNKDTHQRGNIVEPMLLDAVGSATGTDGHRYQASSTAREGLHDGTPMTGVTKGATNVQLDGTPAVFVRPGVNDLGGYNLGGLRPTVLDGTRRIFDFLRPYDRST